MRRAPPRPAALESARDKIATAVNPGPEAQSRIDLIAGSGHASVRQTVTDVLTFAAILFLCGATSSFFKSGWFILIASYILAIAASIAFLVKGDYLIIARLAVGLVSFQASYLIFGISYYLLPTREIGKKYLPREFRRMLGDEPRKR